LTSLEDTRLVVAKNTRAEDGFRTNSHISLVDTGCNLRFDSWSVYPCQHFHPYGDSGSKDDGLHIPFWKKIFWRL